MINTFRYTLKSTTNPIPITQTSCLKTLKAELVKTILTYISDSYFLYMQPESHIVINIKFMQNDLIYAQDLKIISSVFQPLIEFDRFGIRVSKDKLNERVEKYIENLHVDLIREYLGKQHEKN